jgi:hypothetical protein
MIRRQRNQLVEARADSILADVLTTTAYAVHFEAQMHRSRARRILNTSYLQFARTGAAMFCLNPTGMWWLPTDFDT